MVSAENCRLRYAEQIVGIVGVDDPRIRRAFASVPREDFLPPPPWTVISQGVATQTGNIADIYDNVLVAIDRARGINNGEPALHAAWIGAVSPQPGETLIHVGAGTGYYTALLAHLVELGGRVEAYEYESDLAAWACDNLRDYPQVTVHAASAFGRPLPGADVIYVNAGVTAPDAGWLQALLRGGRLIFPWQPHQGWGTTMLVTRTGRGYRAKQLMNVGFISCSGETTRSPGGPRPSEADIAATRSVWPVSEREPDRTATAVYDAVWFSADSVE
ncbi:protein-L-isoaspartate O-methyltransferase [Microvirga sp. GCM10011540]|uniref:protein-L-isoaspartate O-methyltransferase family protein n=1 Tax=Microvirga sp. GCM10011540 TaxID=3317338 RepID=UPI0036139FD7